MLAGPGIPDLVPHDHLCFVYGRDAEVQQALLEYVVAGLARRERVCVFTMPDAASTSIDADLRHAGVPLDLLTDNGTLVFGSAEQMYLTDGVFDVDERLTAYADAAWAAINDGFTGLRGYADSTFLLDHPQALAAWPGYELRADHLACRLPITAMCGYDLRRWTADDLLLAESVHTRWTRGPVAFRLHVGRDGTLRLSGEIDFFVAKQLHRLLVTTAASRPTPTLDVSRVTFIDISGARSLGMACEAIAAEHGPTIVRGATILFRRIWELTSWSHSFPNVVIEG